MNENIQFLQAFLKNPLKVGAVAPSSSDLAWQMLESILPDKENIVVELGVGTGAITKYIREILPDNESYLGIELDDRMVSSLKIRYPEMNVVKGNASSFLRSTIDRAWARLVTFSAAFPS